MCSHMHIPSSTAFQMSPHFIIRSTDEEGTFAPLFGEDHCVHYEQYVLNYLRWWCDGDWLIEGGACVLASCCRPGSLVLSSIHERCHALMVLQLQLVHLQTSLPNLSIISRHVRLSVCLSVVSWSVLLRPWRMIFPRIALLVKVA